MATKQYNVIYADPPWHYRNYADKTASRWVGNQYPVMSLDDIKALPVEQYAANDCCLFLWATMPLLPQAIEVMASWGYAYKTTAFVWIKQNKIQPTLFWGMGYWTRSNSEICLLGTRGKPKRQYAGVHQVVMSPVERHSKKPDIVREHIVRLCGDVPRIELFAREQVSGWDAWGNEI